MARSLPNNVNAEKAVLGAMLISPEALSDSLGSLTEEEFYFGNRPNQIVFRAIKNVQDRRIPVDVQTVTEELLNLKELDSIGGVNYLLELTQTAISFSNLEYYIKIIKDQAVLRNLLLTMTDIASKYNEEELDDPSDFVAIAEARIAKVAENRRISTFLSSKEIAKRVEEDMRTQAKSAEDGVTGITTGYRKLNLLTHGFQRGEMIILAARPSVGKTALAINIAFNASRKADRPVAIFSLEMPAEALIKRLVATVSCVNLDLIQTGYLTGKDRLAIGEALKTVGDTKMYIDDTPGIKLLDIIAKARKLKTANPDLGLIVVDYIGLITTGNKKVESRQVEVSEISRELKELARELKVPILVVSQLSREVDKREGKRPMLSDLRESGSIEQDADQVMLMFRKDYYESTGAQMGSKRKSPEEEKKAAAAAFEERELNKKADADASLVEVIIAKNRNGKTGTVPLLFFKGYGRFDTPSEEYEAQLAKIRQSGGVQDIED